MKKGLLAIIVVLGVCAFAEATDCRRVVRVQHAAVVNHAVVVQPVVAAVFTPIAVAVPAYHAGYASDQIVNELRQLRQEIQQLKAQPEAQRMPQADQQKQALQAPGKHPGFSAINESCVKCHNAALKKGGLVLDSEAAILALTKDQRLSIVNDLIEGRMPPKDQPKLSNEGASDIIALVSGKK